MRAITFFIACSIFTTYACTTTKHATYWVRGHKKSCVGVAEMQCLQVYQGSDLKKAHWEYFYDSIYGFEFEPGYLKKIAVKLDTLKQVPADASSIRHTFVRLIKKQKDKPDLLDGRWELTHILGRKIVENLTAPYIRFEVTENIVSGYDGCNQFFGEMRYNSSYHLQFNRLASTKMMCQDMSIPDAFMDALLKVKSFHQESQTLSLLDQNETETVRFKKSKTL